MEVLTSFVQEKPPGKQNNQQEKPETEEKKFQKITKDVQAALTVIGRRDFSKDAEDKRLDLRKANLIGANLIGADLSRASLRRANFWEVSLSGADLSGAELGRAKKLTLKQVKSANHWEQAIYDPDLREGLGLPPESTTEEEDN